MLKLIHGRPKVTLEVSLINTFYFQTQGVFLVTHHSYILIFLLHFLGYFYYYFFFILFWELKKKTSKCVNWFFFFSFFFLSGKTHSFLHGYIDFQIPHFFFHCFGRASHSLALHVSGIWISWLCEYQMIDAYFECKR